MRCSALQFDVRCGDPEANWSQVEQGLARAREAGVRLVLLPEMWPTSFPGADARREDLVEASARCRERLREACARMDLYAAGSMFHFAGELPTNRFELCGPRGPLLAYDKVHLFSPTAEPASFQAGQRAPGVVEIEGHRLSCAVCYDLRFVELLRPAWLAGVELLLVPCQWPRQRGAQLRALALGAAVWMQAYVLVANRTGSARVGRRGLALEFHGGSLLADPRGRVLAEAREAPAAVGARLDWDDLRALRREVPVRRDRRAFELSAPEEPDSDEDAP